MTMHVVKDPTQPQAGQNGEPDQKPEEAKKTGALFWFVAGLLGGAVLWHMGSRKMQEYAGGAYLSHQRMRNRLGLNPAIPPDNPYAGMPGAIDDDDDDDEGGSTLFFG